MFKSKATKSGIVFIVEDNPAYAKTLEAFIKAECPQFTEVKIFPVGETALMDLKRNPDVVIMDYFLDSKYHDAETGLEIIKKIRADHKEMNIIVLSSQEDIIVVLEAVKRYNCSYVKKDEEAFDRIAELLKEI